MRSSALRPFVHPMLSALLRRAQRDTVAPGVAVTPLATSLREARAVNFYTRPAAWIHLNKQTDPKIT